jgi:hypothetical protein
MTSRPALRRLLAVPAALALVAGLTLGSPALAHAPHSFQPARPGHSTTSDDGWSRAFDRIASFLSTMWEAAGSSMDPLGNH